MTENIFNGLVKMDHRKPPRIILYGPEGVGKTTQACKARDPLVIQTEDGLGTLNVAATPKCETYEEFIEYLEMAASGDHPYKTIIIDSLDWAETLMQKKVCEEKKLKRISDLDYYKGYIAASEYWQEVTPLLNRIRGAGCTVILIGHSSPLKIDDPMRGSYDKTSIKGYKTGASALREWADIIAYADFDLVIKKEEKGFGAKQNRAIADGSRSMYLVGTPAFDAKNRYGLPDRLSFDWAEFQNAFKQAIANKGE